MPELIDDSLAFVERDVDAQTRAAIIMRLPRLYLLLAEAQENLSLLQDTQRLNRVVALRALLLELPRKTSAEYFFSCGVPATKLIHQCGCDELSSWQPLPPSTVPASTLEFECCDAPGRLQLALRELRRVHTSMLEQRHRDKSLLEPCNGHVSLISDFHGETQRQLRSDLFDAELYANELGHLLCVACTCTAVEPKTLASVLLHVRQFPRIISVLVANSCDARCLDQVVSAVLTEHSQLQLLQRRWQQQALLRAHSQPQAKVQGQPRASVGASRPESRMSVIEGHRELLGRISDAMLELARLSRRTALHIRLSLVNARALPTVALALTMSEMDELELANFICEMGSQNGYEWFWSDLARPADSCCAGGIGSETEALVNEAKRILLTKLDSLHHAPDSKVKPTELTELLRACCILVTLTGCSIAQSDLSVLKSVLDDIETVSTECTTKEDSTNWHSHEYLLSLTFCFSVLAAGSATVPPAARHGPALSLLHQSQAPAPVLPADVAALFAASVSVMRDVRQRATVKLENVRNEIKSSLETGSACYCTLLLAFCVMISTRGTHRLQRASITELLCRVLGLPSAALIRTSSTSLEVMERTVLRQSPLLSERDLACSVCASRQHTPCFVPGCDIDSAAPSPHFAAYAQAAATLRFECLLVLLERGVMQTHCIDASNWLLAHVLAAREPVHALLPPLLFMFAKSCVAPVKILPPLDLGLAQGQAASSWAFNASRNFRMRPFSVDDMPKGNAMGASGALLCFFALAFNFELYQLQDTAAGQSLSQRQAGAYDLSRLPLRPLARQMLDGGLFECIRPYFIHLAQQLCPEILPCAGDVMLTRGVFDGEFSADDKTEIRLADDDTPLLNRALRLFDEALDEDCRDTSPSHPLSRLVAQLELAHSCLPGRVLALAQALVSAVLPLALRLVKHTLLPVRTGQLWLKVYAHHPQPQNFGAQTVAALSGRAEQASARNVASGTWQQLQEQPLLPLHCDACVLRCPPLLDVSLRVLHDSLLSSRARLELRARAGGAVAQHCLQLRDVQESMAVQCLVELLVSGADCTSHQPSEPNSSVLHLLDEILLPRPGLRRAVLQQRLPVDTLPVLTKNLRAFSLELLESDVQILLRGHGVSVAQRAFGIALTSAVLASTPGGALKHAALAAKLGSSVVAAVSEVARAAIAGEVTGTEARAFLLDAFERMASCTAHLDESAEAAGIMLLRFSPGEAFASLACPHQEPAVCAAATRAFELLLRMRRSAMLGRSGKLVRDGSSSSIMAM